MAEEERHELERSLAGSGPGRMLREGVAFFAALSSRRPVVLLIEDLHWCDPATLDFLSVIAQRTTEARLLIVGTYRPVEALLHDGVFPSVAAKLRALGGTLLALEPFTRSDVRAYLESRFRGGAVADRVT